MKMDQVYGNARLTIAASRASSVMNGFLGDRDSQPIWAYCGTISYIDKTYPVYMVDEDEMRMFKFHIHEPQGPIGKQPRASRGWAIQERLMSRRIVYVTSNRMIWQCMRGSTTEDGLMCDPQLQLAWIKDNTADSYWYDVVKQYSSCKLSHPGDRLSALDGLEHAIRGLRTDDESLLFGHWKHDIINYLLWIMLPDREPKTQGVVRNPMCKAPTWSWASMAPGVQVRPSYTLHESYNQEKPIGRSLQLPSTSLLVDDDNRAWGLWIRTPFVNGTVEVDSSSPSARLKLNSSPFHTFEIEARLDEFQPDPGLPKQCALVLLYDNGLCSYKGLLMQPVSTDAVRFRRIGTFETLHDFNYEESLIRRLAIEREICLV